MSSRTMNTDISMLSACILYVHKYMHESIGWIDPTNIFPKTHLQRIM